MSFSYVVLDSQATVRFVLRTGLPLEQLVERVCLNCQQTVFLTRKQLNAYGRDPQVRSLKEPLAFACLPCDAAKREAMRQEVGG